MTYAELKTNIANYLNRSDLTSYIDTFIDSTEAELNRRLRTKEMIKRATATADSQYLTVPTDWQEAINVEITSNNFSPLFQQSIESLDVYRKSNNRFIEIIIQRVRSNSGSYAPKGDIGAKKSFLWLRSGKCLALLNDQKLNEGPLINFLGKPAPTASFLAELALRMELDIIPIKFQRTSKYKSTITFMEKIKSPPNYLKHHDKVNKILEEVNSIISSWILEKPDQWFWVHRRWSKKFYKT
mgnify:CR=1 FL=1